MPAAKQQKGPCYLCGFETTKAYMGRHLLTKHCEAADRQECRLLKIEDENGEYWLFVDIPPSSTLSVLDKFLREVWLECCGHASAFRPLRSYAEEFRMNCRIGSFPPGTVIEYEYDFGSTTTLAVTFVGNIYREKQKTAVRVLARNYPYQFNCERCGKQAAWIDAAEWPGVMYCGACAEEVGDDGYLLPIVNSPRMGVCGYCGEFDKFGYKGISKAKKDSTAPDGSEKRTKKNAESKKTGSGAQGNRRV